MSFFEGVFRQRDANDLLATLRTWRQAGISANDVYGGDIDVALRATTARAVVMPSPTDFLFQVGDSALEVEQMADAELRPRGSNWGHVAGFGANAPDNAVVDGALDELLRAPRRAAILGWRAAPVSLPGCTAKTCECALHERTAAATATQHTPFTQTTRRSATLSRSAALRA